MLYLFGNLPNTNLKKHLLKYHKKEYNEFIEIDERNLLGFHHVLDLRHSPSQH